MMVDKNLFLHDLTVVAILKNEAPYLKEWLDYHLLAGVDHFYLYDNDSPDNQREVVKPYVAAGLVDWFDAPGAAMQYAAYNDAVKRFKFRCRYMAFIDGDEFIFPKTNQSIVDVIDEILSQAPNAAGLSINWQIFGSNGHEHADFSHGVLERFTRRAPKDFGSPKNVGDRYESNTCVKTIADPRKIDFVGNAHYVNFFDNFHSVDENSAPVKINGHNCPVLADKIVINHYKLKSREEYLTRAGRGYAADLTPVEHYTQADFDNEDRNDIFDDGILRYRDERAKTFQSPDMSRAAERLLNALTLNLSPTLLPTTPPNFYAGKLETFLTCRKVAALLKTNLVDDATANFFEETALKAILRSLNGMSFADARLFLRELPKLLGLPYPVAEEIRAAASQIVTQMMDVMHLNGIWKDYVELDYLNDILKLGG